MTKNIKDYLPFYLGCEVYLNNDGLQFRHKLIAVYSTGLVQTEITYSDKNTRKDCFNAEYIKPILRPLSDMTEEEAIEVLKYDKVYHKDFSAWIADFVKWEKQKVYNPHEFVLLLSKHFDLFGLIEAGLAIDKTKHPVRELV